MKLEMKEKRNIKQSSFGKIKGSGVKGQHTCCK